MVLKLYNTRTRKKEEFRPLDETAGKPPSDWNVRMYVCGPTVYDYAHIGNARPVIVFDVLYRLLRHLYGEDHVTYVRNITDVDDKINARAAEEGVPIRELTDRTLAQFHADVAALGCLLPDEEPRATDHIEEMKAMIETLVEKGCAYVAEDHVLFQVAAMPDYGQLARRSLDEMQAGARVEVAPYKRDPMDFVLWKPSKDGEQGWPSPCGISTPGRPGWHIECSAMSKAYLGETFDIHGGGIDLVFPHHENEVAQSRCAHGTDVMANVWMHNGFLQVEGQKMSKSDGNFFTINELLEDWIGDVLRLSMLMTNYREPINWTNDKLETARELLEEWSAMLIDSQGQYEAYSAEASRKELPPTRNLTNALADDLNTHEAIAVLHSHMDKIRKGADEASISLMADAEFLGLLRHDRLWLHQTHLTGDDQKAVALEYYDEVQKLRVALANKHSLTFKKLASELASKGVHAEVAADGSISLSSEDNSLQNKVKELISARNKARKGKKWTEADSIRDQLAAMGIALEDARDPETGEIVTTWEIAR